FFDPRCFFFSSRRRHTRFSRDWSSDVCSSYLFRTYAEVTIAAYFDGAGLRPRHTWDQTTRQAVQIVTDQAVLVDLWLRYRMATLAPWPKRVRRAADGNHCPNRFSAGNIDRSEGTSTI